MEIGDQHPVMFLLRAWNRVLGCGQGEGRPMWGYWGPGSQDWNIVNCLKTLSETPFSLVWSHQVAEAGSGLHEHVSTLPLASVSLAWVSYVYLNLLCTSFVWLHCQSKRNMASSKWCLIVNKICSWHPFSRKCLCSTKQYHTEVLKIR